MQSLSEAEQREIKDHIAAGRKIEAIKAYRTVTGADLAKAKNFVDSLAAEPRGPVPADVDQQLLDLIFAGRKIEAIKMYRGMTQADLKTAKDFVDALEARLRLEMPERFNALVVSGSSPVVLLVLAVAAGVLGVVLALALLG